LSRCSLCETKGLDHDAQVKLFESSIYGTCVGLCQWDRIDGSLIHRLVCDWIQYYLDSKERNILVLLPRDFLKTSTLIGIWVREWIKNPELRNLLLHASSTVSAKVVPVVENIILRPDGFAHYFPDLVPDTNKVSWSNTEMCVARKGNYAQASLEARGIRSTTTGGHFDRLWLDDLIDEKIANSLADQKRAVISYEASDDLLDAPESELTFVAGTLWQGPFYPRLLRSKTFRTLQFGAEWDERFESFLAEMGENPDALRPSAAEFAKAKRLGLGGPGIWSSQWPTDRLARMKKRKGYVSYCRQKLNKEVTDEEQRFKEEDFKDQWYNFDPNGRGVIVHDRFIPWGELFIVATVDPATGESDSTDEAAIIVAGSHEATGTIVVLDLWHGRALPDRLSDLIFKANERWKPRGLQWVGVESQGYQATYMRWLKRDQVSRRTFFALKPILAPESKATRIIDGLIPFISNHQIFFLRNQRDLIQEAIDFRVVGGKVMGRSPAMLDALAMQIKGWTVALDDEALAALREQDGEFVLPPPTRAYGLEMN
jgi:hypothetical protein